MAKLMAIYKEKGWTDKKVNDLLGQLADQADVGTEAEKVANFQLQAIQNGGLGSAPVDGQAATRLNKLIEDKNDIQLHIDYTSKTGKVLPGFKTRVTTLMNDGNYERAFQIIDQLPQRSQLLITGLQGKMFPGKSDKEQVST